MVSEQEILASDRCSVVAPAGCGKTELIVRAVQAYEGKGRFLVLTHTHAGVRALRSRFSKRGVSRDKFAIETIAGWCLSYARAYPVTAALTNPMPTGGEWDGITDGVINLLALPAIQKVLRESYVGVFVDEYQDCTSTQHRLICALADILPCRILGDPLQGIFAFAGGSLSWTVVEAAFPSLGVLDHPWRWDGKNLELGQWLLAIREPLMAGEPIDLSTAPVQWSAQAPDSQRALALGLLRHEQPVVAIRKMPGQAHEFARGMGRAYQSMEEIECKDLLAFTGAMDTLQGVPRALRVIDFAKNTISGLSAHIATLEGALRTGKTIRTTLMREPARRAFAEALIRITESQDVEPVKEALSAVVKLPRTRIFREELWHEARKTLDSFDPAAGKTLYDTAWSMRNKSRFIDRDLARHVVSRTLLIKGLEFDHSFIPALDEFRVRDRHSDSAKHFYVAATRGSRSLTILSNQPILQFPRPTL